MKIWVALVIFLLGLAGVTAFLAKRRRDALRAWAHREGMQCESDGAPIVSVLSHLKLIGRSRRRKAYNVLTCGSGAQARWVFDFRYRVGGGRNSRTYRQTVVVFPYMSVNLPAFELRPENLLHKLGATFGYQDIDFHEYPQFSAKHLLRGHDESSIRQLFDFQLVHAFDGLPGYCVEAAGSCLLVYRHRHVVAVNKLGDFVRRAERLRDVFVARATELGWFQPGNVTKTGRARADIVDAVAARSNRSSVI